MSFRNERRREKESLRRHGKESNIGCGQEIPLVGCASRRNDKLTLRVADYQRAARCIVSTNVYHSHSRRYATGVWRARVGGS
jgi:hypothetical protein